jgi:hypothetical protein
MAPEFKMIPAAIKNKAWLLSKEVYKRIYLRPRDKQRIGFIVGSQRSGTTMLSKAFNKDLRSKTYGEAGLAKGFGRGSRHRLLPYDEISHIFSKEKAPLLIAKPLVESQNIVQLLDYFPDSKAIWVYRQYKDVAMSHKKKFGDASTHYHLRAVIDPKLNDHWYAENTSENTKRIVMKYYTKDRTIFDLKALAWYVRNILFFELELHLNQRVTLLKYEDFVLNPSKVMKQIYEYLDLRYPGDRVVKRIHSYSINKGQSVQLSLDIQCLCEKLLADLDSVYQSSSLSQF